MVKSQRDPDAEEEGVTAATAVAENAAASAAVGPGGDEEEEVATTKRRLTKISIRGRTDPNSDPDRALRERMKKLAEMTILISRRCAKYSNKKEPNYLNSFEAYSSLLEKSKTLDAFRPSLIELFKSHRGDIITEDVNGEWLSEAKLGIKLNIVPRDPSNSAKFKDFYLDISKGFRNALRLVDLAESQKATDVSSRLPELYLYYLYQVFREVAAKEADKQTIDDILGALDPQSSPSGTLANINPGAVKTIVSAALEMLKDISPGFDTSAINPDSMADAFSNITKNKTLGKLVNNLGSELKECKSPNEFIDTLAKHAAPDSRSEIREAIGQIGGEIKKSQDSAVEEPPTE